MDETKQPGNGGDEVHQTEPVLIDTIAVPSGSRIELDFESVAPRWRQGVRLATAGEIHAHGWRSNGLHGSEVVVWSDEHSGLFIEAERTDGSVSLHNVWSRGRAHPSTEARHATSGMRVEVLPDGSRRYRCRDVGEDVDFDQLVFRVRVQLPNQYPCPCCGHLVFRDPPGSHDICPICCWEDDAVQIRDQDSAGGANVPSLMEAQRMYAAIGATEERFVALVRPATTDEPLDPGWRPFDPDVDLTPIGDRSEMKAPWRDATLYWWRPTYWRRGPGDA